MVISENFKMLVRHQHNLMLFRLKTNGFYLQVGLEILRTEDPKIKQVPY